MQPIRILTIDGGGVRGAIAAAFLKEVERELGQSIYDAVDLFAGTSTGALIALYITAKRATAQSACDDMYVKENLDKIMDKSLFDKLVPVQHKPKYDGKGKTRVAADILGDTRLQEVEKKVLVTSYDIMERHIVVYKSWGGMHCESNPKLSEIADATSAAPVYFPTVHSESDHWLIDGGMAANNPSMCALAEAIRLGYTPDKIHLISLGTGIATRHLDDREQYGKESQDWGALGWVSKGDLIQHLFDGNSSSMHYFCRQMLGNNYVRVNGNLSGVAPELDETSQENITALKALGKNWFDEHRESVLKLLQI